MVLAIAGWMNRHQQAAIEYLREENRVLREVLGQKRIRLNDSQRARLGEAAARVGRGFLQQIATMFTPDTLLRWHRWFIARKYDGSARRGKRGPAPTKANMIRKLVLRMAQENPTWGYGHIHGELKGLGYDVSWQTVRRVMLDHGLIPDPDRPYKTTWKEFLQRHWESLSACDFFSVEAWGLKGLVRYFVYFVVDISTRRVEIAGITDCPTERWMVQQARNLTDSQDGFLKDKRILIHDRDPLYTEQFRETLRATGVRSLKIPKQSPNLNAYAERFVLAIKSECLDHLILIGEKHLRHVVEQYVEYYMTERPHRVLGHRIIEPDEPRPSEGRVECRPRLGGLLKTYFRRAA